VNLEKEGKMRRYYSKELDEYFYDEDPDDPGIQFCLGCGEEVRIVKKDFGIGPYEFWGARGVDHDYHWVCSKCDGDNYCRKAVQCSRCGQWVNKEKVCESGDQLICEICYEKEDEE